MASEVFEATCPTGCGAVIKFVLDPGAGAGATQRCQCANGHFFRVQDGSTPATWIAMVYDGPMLVMTLGVTAAWRAGKPTSWTAVAPNGNIGGETPPPTYHKVLVHGKREYRIGTCGVCARENTPLANYRGRAITATKLCSSCVHQMASEATEAESQLYMARSGGRIEERKDGLGS